MPKGEYVRSLWGDAWTEEQDAFLKEACKTSQSYREIATEFNRRFKDCPNKSRSAILGRASRMGYNVNKPMALGGKKVIGAKGPKAADKRIKGTGVRPVDRVLTASKNLAPVEFDDGLRDDNGCTRLPSDMFSGHRKLTAEDIAEQRKGKLPSIIEAKPLTSKPIFESAHNECKWPTSSDVRSMEVCGAPATHGAYCERHANVAYRAMPTRKRNGSYSRKGFEEERKRISDADAQWIADNVLDDEVTTAPVEHSLLEFTPGTGRPFNGNKS